MANTLFLMCGPAGSGKTTWVKNHIGIDDIHISRDAIRFSMVKENEDYFSKEKEVFQHFINAIKTAIYNSDIENIYADATHLNKKARAKVLSQLPLKDIDVIPVNIHIPKDRCIYQNSLRTGRYRVPDKVIEDMFLSYDPASHSEEFVYKDILEVDLI